MPAVIYNPRSLFDICCEHVSLNEYDLSSVAGDVVNRLFNFYVSKQSPQVSQVFVVFRFIF